MSPTSTDTRYGCLVEDREFPVQIDSQLLITDLLELGRYDKIAQEIPGSLIRNAASTKKEERKLTLKLFGFTKEYEPRDQVEKLRLNSLQPCNLTELLAFGVQYPEEQRALSIAGFGSWEMFGVAFIWVPCLWSEQGQRLFGFRSPFTLKGPSHRLLCMPLDDEFDQRTSLYIQKT